jgi:RhoGEF domain
VFSFLFRKRKGIVEELVETERSYVRALDLACFFADSLREAGLSASDEHTLFLNIPDLAQHHRGLVAIFEEENVCESGLVGEILLSRTDFLSDYRKYVANYPT